MTRNKKIAVAAIGVAVFGLYNLVTGGGIAIEHLVDFNGQRDIELAKGLKSDVWLSPKATYLGVPLLFHYSATGKPFGLRLQIWDESNQYRQLTVDEILVEYADGEVVRINKPWTRTFRTYTQYNYSSGTGLIERKMFMMSDTIERLVLKHSNVKVSIKGRLEKMSGEVVSFSTSESFETESKLHFGTYWQLAND